MDTTGLYKVHGLWYYLCPKCTHTTVNNLTSRAEALVAKRLHEGECKK